MKDEFKTYLASEERIALFNTLHPAQVDRIIATYTSLDVVLVNKSLAYLASATGNHARGDLWRETFELHVNERAKATLRCCYLADRAYLVEAMLPRELFEILIKSWESVFGSPYYEDYQNQLLELKSRR